MVAGSGFYPNSAHEARVGSLSADVGCLIRATPGPDFTRLEAIAQSDRPVSGQYALSIVKQSSTGSSHNIRAATFR
jgi:hypothetical protein